MIKQDIEKVLNLNISEDEADTILDYLHHLLQTLMDKKEGFSGKHPFGDSGWEYDLYIPMVKAGFVSGKIDEDGYVNSIDKDEADAVLTQCIVHVFYGR